MAHLNGQRTVNLGAVITHTAASTGTTGPTLDTHQGVGCMVLINVTAISGTTPTLTVTLQGVDPTSGATYTILASPAINATGLTVLRVYPGITASANSAANDIMPNQAKVVTAIGGTTPSVTATITVLSITGG